ncbi:hypothetical protein H072_8412 [Dactylellina haptotyla CBS 200.50]|uniref:Uncharacterized protein n=1 Tax=Dactylellina haptotyla (strain CBS 200.50) TaxID=1284197 RepID=S8A460_DACHA|nr:hypothetical protein H072_8412 [Dactylellina haptotyla CBS 200.50]
METENEGVWGTPRDELLEQLSSLLTELANHEEGLCSSFELLDHLDGTRRAIDRLSAVITDKFHNPSSVEFFSPSVTRPLSTSTDASNSSSEHSLDSQLTHLSSPTTLISDYDDDNHRRRLLEETEEIFARTQQGNAEDAEEDGTGDQDERLERLSLLLSSVLKEANEAIKDYDIIHEEPEEEVQAEIDTSFVERGEVTTRCSSRLAGNPTSLIGTAAAAPRSGSPVDRDVMKSPLYSLPALQSTETLRPMLQQPPTAPPTPPPCEDKERDGLLPILSPDQLSVSSLTSSAETVRPQCLTPRPERVFHTEFSTQDDDEGGVKLDGEFALDDPRELSLEYLLGDYLTEVINDVRRNEFVGARFWIFLIAVMGMWTWMFVTDTVNNFIGNLACACKA